MQGSFSEAFEQVVESAGSSAINYKRIQPPFLSASAKADKRGDAFKSALKRLSDLDCEAALNEESIDEFISFFRVLYGTGDGYRHLYSDVCAVMYSYMGTDENLDLGSIPDQALSLARNAALLAQEICNEERQSVIEESEQAGDRWKDVRKSVIKLRDHIELERTRMDYVVKQNARLVAASEDAKASAKQAREAAEAIDKDSQAARARFAEMVDDSKREYVTILGIFAAIVIAFTAGSAFSASVLQNIAEASIYRLSFVALIIGFFLFNVISVLLMFILKVSKIKDDTNIMRVIKYGDMGFAIAIMLVVIARCAGFMSIIPPGY